MNEADVIRMTPGQDALDKSWDFARKKCQAKHPDIRDKDNFHEGREERAYSHFIGNLGECAFSAITGVPMNEEVFSHGDGIDFGTVEVKGSTWQRDNIELKVEIPEWHKKKAKYYVLTRVNPTTYQVQLLSYISREEYDKAKRVKNYGHVDNYIVGLGDMHQITYDNLEMLKEAASEDE